MLKRVSKRKIWNIATTDIINGGARASLLANRIKDHEARQIVSRVYSVSAIQTNPFLGESDNEWDD